MFTLSKLMAGLAIASWSAVAAARATYQRSKCDASTLNTTIGTYTVAQYDTIFTIAADNQRGVCDIARANRMADATIINVGEELIIPAQVCHPDEKTCLLVDTHPTRDCILGGPHTYTTFPNDTVASIALTKFNITVESLWNSTSRMLAVADAYSVIPVGNNLKLPQCSPSQCIIQPYSFTYGTYKDLAAQVGTTPGQIFAFNPTYNHSDGPAGTGPVITMPMKCELLSSNYTEIS
jgi:LysM domain